MFPFSLFNLNFIKTQFQFKHSILKIATHKNRLIELNQNYCYLPPIQTVWTVSSPLNSHLKTQCIPRCIPTRQSILGSDLMMKNLCFECSLSAH